MENTIDALLRELNEYQVGTVKKDEELARHTTMKIGGPADLFIEPDSIEGKRILEYKGIVCGEVISGVDFIKDFAAGLTNFFGGRSKSYEDELIRAREGAIEELKHRALSLGANAVIGIDIDSIKREMSR